MFPRIIFFMIVFVFSCNFGINLIEILTALTVLKSDPVNHLARTKRLEKNIMVLTAKNAVYLAVLLVVFITLMLFQPDLMHIYYAMFGVILVSSFFIYSVINPYLIDKVKPIRTRTGKRFSFKTQSKRENKIISFLGILRLINTFLFLILFVYLVRYFLVHHNI